MSTLHNEFDALVIGAGFAGMYQLFKLRELGLSVRVFEAGSDVGGVWYWNRYPGCRFDSESYTYGYSFSDDLLQEWSWSEEYAAQPETLRYCQYVADKFDLRRDITFNTRIESATYVEEKNIWELSSEDGDVFRAQYLISAMGPLSAPQMPRLDGIGDFQGEAYHTGLWPHHDVDFDGKRVAVIGTGSSGVQVIQEVAKTARNLTVFQRSPNWCVPLMNQPISDEKQRSIKGRFPEIFEQCKNTVSCFLFESDPRKTFDVSEEERRVFFEDMYSKPGFAKWIGGFRDSLMNEEANKALSEFMANKIRGRINDSKLADKLIPKDHGYGTKRLALETNYFEVYNQDNVELVDLRENPIKLITENGIKTSEKEREFDIIIYATGFDPVIGSLNRVHIRGINGQKLSETWAEGPTTYLGLSVVGFPNMFTLIGPHNTGTLCNIPRCIEQNVNWVIDLIRFMRKGKFNRVEPTEAAQEKWTNHVYDMASRMLFSKVDSWFTGRNTNLPDRKIKTALIYAGGAPLYNKICNEEASCDYPNFVFDQAQSGA